MFNIVGALVVIVGCKLSYAESYGYGLDTLSKEAVYEQVMDEETGEYKIGDPIEASE